MSEYKGIEMHFCKSWAGWDEMETMSLQFQDVALLPHIAERVGRDHVDWMVVDGNTSTVEFGWDEDQTISFEFTVTLK